MIVFANQDDGTTTVRISNRVKRKLEEQLERAEAYRARKTLKQKQSTGRGKDKITAGDIVEAWCELAEQAELRKKRSARKKRARQKLAKAAESAGVANIA